MKYVTVTEAKSHLRVDFSDDDTYIRDLCDMAEAMVQMEIGEDSDGDGLPELEDEDGNIPLPLKHAILLLVGHLYMLREPVVVGVNVTEVPMSFKYLLSGYKNWTVR